MLKNEIKVFSDGVQFIPYREGQDKSRIENMNLICAIKEGDDNYIELSPDEYKDTLECDSILLSYELEEGSIVYITTNEKECIRFIDSSSNFGENIFENWLRISDVEDSEV